MSTTLDTTTTITALDNMSNGDTDFEDLKSSVFGIDLENAILSSSSSSSSSLNNSSSSILALSALEPPSKETTNTNTLTVPSNRPPSPLLNTSNGSSPSTPSSSSSITKSLPENRKLKKNVSFKLPTNITVSDIIAASASTTTTTQSPPPSSSPTLDPSVDLDSLLLNKVMRTHSSSVTTPTPTKTTQNSEQQQQQQQQHQQKEHSETDTTNTNATNVERENNNKVSVDKEKPIINASTITNTATVTTIPNNITKLPPEVESPTPSPSALHISREGPNSKFKEQIKPKEILKHQDSLSPLTNTPNPLARINSSPRPIIHHTPTVTTTSLSPSPLSSSSSTLNSLNLHESSHNNNVNMGDSTELVSMLLERLSSSHQERLSLIKKNMVDLKATFQTLQEEKELDAREVTKIQQNAPPEPKKWDFGQYLGWILSSFLFVVLISVLIEEESDAPYFPGYT